MVTAYSTWLPDGRTLIVDVSNGDPVYKLAGTDGREQKISKKDAEYAWNEQPEEWQRGRTLDAALATWRGRTG